MSTHNMFYGEISKIILLLPSNTLLLLKHFIPWKSIVLVVLQFFQFKVMFFSLKSSSVFHNTQLFYRSVTQIFIKLGLIALVCGYCNWTKWNYSSPLLDTQIFIKLGLIALVCGYCVKQGAAIVPLLKTLVCIYYNRGTQQEKDDKTNKMTWASSEDSDQPGHLPNLRCPHEETMGC